MRITEDQIIEAIQNHLTTCDADELARIAGQALGGTCYYYPKTEDDLPYVFMPTERYGGAFKKGE